MTVRTGLASFTALASVLVGLGACGGAPAAPAPPRPSAGGSASAKAGAAPSGSAAARAAASGSAAVPISLAPKGFIEQVAPSRLFPDLQGDRGVIAREGGDRRILLDRMRLIVREDGSIQRASERLPPGSVTSVALPSRLGGGFLFHANTAGGTQIWKAPSWLAKLKPLVQLSTVASDILPGFDRLYVRFQNNSRMSALNVETGEPMSLAPLPIAASYGQLAFADGWRAVVDTDLRGPLATFDAGTTWRPIDLHERATAVGIVNGDPAVFVGGGRYQIDAHGLVTYRADITKESARGPDGPPAPIRPPGPLGKRPLRAALEDGWPDSPTTAVVARGGALSRVSLEDGAVLATTDEAYPDRRAACHGIRLGKGFGFLCGERDSATTVYDFVPPLGMKPVMRFARPRFIAPSGNGALVVRGACTDDGEPAGESRSYCVRSVSGATREIRVKGDLGVERVIALSDDRVAVLVPPRGGSNGQITLLDGSTARSVALVLPTEPRSAVRELRRGMWLDGYEEHDKGVISGWIEAGGPVVGVRITLDGKVTAGPVREDAGGALLSGRFGLSLGDGGRAAETTDGGQHWEQFDLPERDEEPSRANNTRACGPVGCALGNWLRVGWGRPAASDDLRPVDAPQAPYMPIKVPQTLWFNCELGAVAATPAPVAVKGPTPAKPVATLVRRGVVGGVLGGTARPTTQGPLTPSGWNPFRGVPGPALGNDEIGFDHGPYADTVLMRAYAWGKRGADWTRNGRWLVRFDDRFDATGGVRSSAATASLWPDEGSTADAIGNGAYNSINWGAFLDPAGNAVLASACRGQSCAFYSIGDGQPVLPIRDASGRSNTLSRPVPGGAVRVGETWFFLTQGPASDSVILHRVDLGVARVLGTYYRPARYGIESPRLVRRALGGGLGLLVGSGPDPGERVGMWYVLPIDPDTGALGETTTLVRRDYAGVAFERCAPGQDGWLFESTFDSPAAVQLSAPGGYVSFDGIELRGRMDPGTVCIDNLASRVDGLTNLGKPKPGAPPPPKPQAIAPMDEATAIPLASTERGTGKRWALQCQYKRPWLFKR